MSFIFSCKGCNKREPGCHDRCETYKQEKAEYDRQKAVARKDDVYLAYAREAGYRRKTTYLKEKIIHKRFKG